MEETLTAPLIKPAEVATETGHGRGDMATVAADGRGDMATAASNGLHGSASAGAKGAGDKNPGSKRAGLSDKSDDLASTNSDKKRKESGPCQIQILHDKSLKFADAAATSSMASEAVCFLRAVEEFATGKDRKKKVTDTELSRTGRVLWDAASRAPASEAALAAVAIEITDVSLQILLSSEDRRSRPCDMCRRWLERLRAAVWRPEPTLPLHRARLRQRQEKLADKRQALFGVALASPVALLTSAAGVQVFPSAFVPWIVVISAVLWIAVSCGLVMDLYGKTNLEFRLASCLSRLGMIGVTVLFCLFIFGAFFPSATGVMWALVAIAVALHAFLCVVSRTPADDQASTSDSGANETASKCCGCTCSCHRALDV